MRFLWIGMSLLCSVSLALAESIEPTQIQSVLPYYSRLSAESWPVITPQKMPLKVGMSDPAVPAILYRLGMLGDFSGQPSASLQFSLALANAVKHFQWRHGLQEDGVLGAKTLQALNVSPAKRFAELQKSLQQFAQFPTQPGARYIHVNIPSYQLDVVEEGRSVLSMKVVVGKKTRPTPELYSKVQTIVFNPTWNVPITIATQDIAKKMQANPNYLAENNIEMYSNWSQEAYPVDPASVNWHKISAKNFPYRLTQGSGDQNALGRVKFIFMNDHDVYMHDTPQKGLFSEMMRAHSSGCIRLEKPFELVEYFIQQDPNLTAEKVNKILESGQVKYVKIHQPIPIYITYITAWADDKGVAHFREDVYQRDQNQK